MRGFARAYVSRSTHPRYPRAKGQGPRARSAQLIKWRVSHVQLIQLKLPGPIDLPICLVSNLSTGDRPATGCVRVKDWGGVTRHSHPLFNYSRICFNKLITKFIYAILTKYLIVWSVCIAAVGQGRNRKEGHWAIRSPLPCPAHPSRVFEECQHGCTLPLEECQYSQGQMYSVSCAALWRHGLGPGLARTWLDLARTWLGPG